jgi:hypothetical protein
MTMKRGAFLPALLIFLIFTIGGIFAQAQTASAWAADRLYVPIITRSGTLPTGVILLNSHYSYVVTSSLDDALHIVGEVFNNSDQDLSDVQITAILYDANGIELDQDTVPIYLDNLPAGEKTCFHLLFSPLLETWATYELQTPVYQSGGSPWPNLTVTDLDIQYNPPQPDLHLIGSITNEDTRQIQFIDMVGTLYNQVGKVVGCNKTALFSLDPGEITPVDIPFTGRDYGDVNAYRLQADGMPK